MHHAEADHILSRADWRMEDMQASHPDGISANDRELGRSCGPDTGAVVCLPVLYAVEMSVRLIGLVTSLTRGSQRPCKLSGGVSDEL